NWIVAIDNDGHYGCSCPVWKFKRQECHHIKLVKMGGGGIIEKANRPEYVLAVVNKPILDEKNNRLLCPLVGIPDAMMMEATICFYLLRNGYSMGEVRELRHVPRDWSARAIMAHIERHGEAEYPEGWYRH
ncbi:unnamed protein product, partial [marine sediment metagenome]